MYFGHMLLFAFIYFFYDRIKWDNSAVILRTIFIYDLWVTPAGLVLGMWRFVEYLYLVRLALWGVVVYSLTKQFGAMGWLIKTISFISFSSWLVFRIYKEWEPVQISPYIFDF
jgi:hypothetical protein